MDKIIKTTQDIRQLGTILSVWAHPDDETFSCAGLMAAAIQNGQTVVCVTATKGEAGVQDESRWPAAQLGAIRAKEMAGAMEVLGITEHHWLDYPDGECAIVPLEEGADRIRTFISKYQPDTILAFGPDGLTGHTDHIAVSRWATTAAQLAPSKPTVYYAVEEKNRYEQYLKKADEEFNIYFNIEQPFVIGGEDCDICFDLTPELCRLKREALKAMPSQTEGMLKHFGDQQAFNTIYCVETFVLASRNLVKTS